MSTLENTADNNTSIDRRSVLKALTALSAAGGLAACSGTPRSQEKFGHLSVEEATARGQESHGQLMGLDNIKMFGNEVVAMVIYPGFTSLDMIGPQYMLASMMGAKVHLVAASLEPIITDTGIKITPDLSFADAPTKVDVLFVPGGGQGTVNAMQDPELIGYVSKVGQTANYVTSVCTGSLILGMAGLLKGKKATSHWVTREVLPLFGAVESDKRLVVDGNVVTGAGVSAGLDFGLYMLATLRGDSYAQAIQLQAEYAPEPPFNAGTPQTAPEDIVKGMGGMYAPIVALAAEVARSKS